MGGRIPRLRIVDGCTLVCGSMKGIANVYETYCTLRHSATWHRMFANRYNCLAVVVVYTQSVISIVLLGENVPVWGEPIPINYVDYFTWYRCPILSRYTTCATKKDLIATRHVCRRPGSIATGTMFIFFGDGLHCGWAASIWTTLLSKTRTSQVASR